MESSAAATPKRCRAAASAPNALPPPRDVEVERRFGTLRSSFIARIASLRQALRSVPSHRFFVSCWLRVEAPRSARPDASCRRPPRSPLASRTLRARRSLRPRRRARPARAESLPSPSARPSGRVRVAYWTDITSRSPSGDGRLGAAADNQSVKLRTGRGPRRRTSRRKRESRVPLTCMLHP